jgi:uncharacterized protein YdaU (DUF1376 family)
MESEAFLTDLDFVAMTLEQRGAYLTMILYLYCNNGKCDLDIAALSQLCNKSTRTFEKIWQGISKKFQSRNGVIRHKRVTKELRRARKYRQAKSRAGLKGADKRWHSQSTAIAKERKRNVIEEKDKDSSYSNATSKEHSHTTANSLRPRPDKKAHLLAFNFNMALTKIIKPRNQSDRTCFANITSWLRDGYEIGRFDEQIFARVLDYVKEAAAGRNPAAVFVSLLKKELDYRPRAIQAKQL